ncbi:hypothetical protein ABIC45_002695 [Mucilaginibacter rubeus]
MLPDYPEMVIVLLFTLRCKNRGVGYRLFSLFNAGIKFFAISLIIRKVIGISFWRVMFDLRLVTLLFKSGLPLV